MQYDLNVLFVLRNAQVDQNGLSPIYLRITVNGQSVTKLRCKMGRIKLTISGGMCKKNVIPNSQTNLLEK